LYFYADTKQYVRFSVNSSKEKKIYFHIFLGVLAHHSMVLGKPSAFLVVVVEERRLDRISSANDGPPELNAADPPEFGIDGPLELGTLR